VPGPHFKRQEHEAVLGAQGGRPGQRNGPGTDGHIMPDGLAAGALCMAKCAAPSAKFGSAGLVSFFAINVMMIDDEAACMMIDR